MCKWNNIHSYDTFNRRVLIKNLILEKVRFNHCNHFQHNGLELFQI
jgi:hypothetical protein